MESTQRLPPYRAMRTLLRLSSIAWVLGSWVALPGCASQDPYRVADDDLKVRWCPESGETTVHFDFGEASETPSAPRLWRGSYHVTVYADRAAMGSGVSHKAILEGQAVSDEDIAPLTPGRAWRITVRGELVERPKRVGVRMTGHGAASSDAASRTQSRIFELLASDALAGSECWALKGAVRAPPQVDSPE